MTAIEQIRGAIREHIGEDAAALPIWKGKSFSGGYIYGWYYGPHRNPVRFLGRDLKAALAKVKEIGQEQ